MKISGVGKFEGKSETIHVGQMLEISSSGFGLPQPTLNAIEALTAQLRRQPALLAEDGEVLDVDRLHGVAR